VPGIVTSTAYAADGQTLVVAYPNGVTTTFAYDPERRWVESILTENAGGTLQQLDYLHDVAARIASVASSRLRAERQSSYQHRARHLHLPECRLAPPACPDRGGEPQLLL
jgi:YD repeat-containing protein